MIASSASLRARCNCDEWAEQPQEGAEVSGRRMAAKRIRAYESLGYTVQTPEALGAK